MKLAPILKEEYDALRSAVLDADSTNDPTVDEESKIVLLINSLESQSDVISQLQSLQLTSSKYKAIQEFANLIGIKPIEFHQFVQQARIQNTI